MDNDVFFLELQERLHADTNGEARQSLESRLDELAGRFKRSLDAGAPPAEFARLQALHDSASAARDVIGTVWRRYHPDTRA
jgi:hypothetical protein